MIWSEWWQDRFTWARVRDNLARDIAPRPQEQDKTPKLVEIDFYFLNKLDWLHDYRYLMHDARSVSLHKLVQEQKKNSNGLDFGAQKSQMLHF